VQQYDNLGSRPWQPVQVGDELWVVFRDSDTLAVLDAQTGTLRRMIALGDAPQPPVYRDGSVWVYNTGDGTLQQILPVTNRKTATP
jgi:DNA-binding beta-propeller fold protein YncE